MVSHLPTGRGGLVTHKDVIDEMGSSCVLMRVRLISRVLTGFYDEELRPFGIGAPQFALLGAISIIEPATRAEVGRFHHQDRSTLTRNLRIILSEGWVQEIQSERGGRGRPIVLTKKGRDLLRSAEPVWRVAQARAKALLGRDGVTAVTKIGSRLMESKT
jgi:DNA-binding MarR family transcriptional regulator